MHPAVMEYVHETVLQYGPFSSVLEIGSKDVNGSVRPLFAGAFYWGTDIVPGAGVDEVVDFGTRTKPSTERWDCIVCTEVLEHAPNAVEILKRAHEHLEHGGLLILTAANERRPPHSARDGGSGQLVPPEPDEWYCGVTHAMLCTWLREAGFQLFDVDVLGADIRAVAWKGLQRTDMELDETLPADLRKLP